MKLWQRYFFFETLRVFLFVLGAFYLFFVVIDYSLHTKLFGVSHVPLLKTIGYYLAQFSTRATLLVPFSLLLATVKVLTTLTTRGETVALLSSGVPMRKLLKPLIGVAVGATIFLYLNAEVLYPVAADGTKRFEERYFRGGKPNSKPLSTIILKDDSTLLFASDAGQMRDIYWIKSPLSQEIVHMESLTLGTPPIGTCIDFLRRGENGMYTITGHLDSAPLYDLPLVPGEPQKPLPPPDELALSQLIKRLPKTRNTDYTARIATSLHQKIALPLICLLVVVAPAPFCLSFTRQKPLFIIYALSIAAFLCFVTLMDAATLLGEHHTLAPFWAIWTPILALTALFGGKYLRLGSV